MSIDHKRPMPVDPERLDHITYLLTRNEVSFNDLEDFALRREIMALALAAEQVEWSKQISFYLAEAYHIYNARFR